MMTDLTEERLDELLEMHPAGDVHETLTALKSLIGKCESETDAIRKDALEREIRALAAALDHERREADRAGEDYINDGEFFAR